MNQEAAHRSRTLHNQGYFSTFHAATESAPHLQQGFDSGFDSSLDLALQAGEALGRSAVCRALSGEAQKEGLLDAVRDGLGAMVAVANSVTPPEEPAAEKQVSSDEVASSSDDDDWLCGEEEDEEVGNVAPALTEGAQRKGKGQDLAAALHENVIKLTSS
ncbi:hypothetical protein TeGR_g11227 [Tetraparma gracilis]|uniref:Protein YAE1 n=1 Tax=Tetraparma gracilis TaxID=2962635 RepID=A0ABQ6MJ63_9STRA|nr:hypothetical protein TeGR_g11227 [Tetraparma gracilis]